VSHQAMPTKSAARQLAAFLNKYDPSIAGAARKGIRLLRKRLPGAFVLIYDNYNALAIAFSPSDSGAQAILSIAVYPRWISLFFGQGAKIPDPLLILKGRGTKMRHVVLHDPSTIQTLAIENLIAAAVALSKPPIDASKKRPLIVKAISKKQRPRRPVR
jgi:hypothetical protein